MPATVMARQQAGPLVMQGQAVPAGIVDAREFFRRTQRNIVPTRSTGFAGLGSRDDVKLLEVGIISGLVVKFSGTLTLTPGAGTIASTARWPYDLLSNILVSANGQSNLINCSGAKLKALEIMSRGDLTDRGVSQNIGGASPGTARTQGTLSKASESWGVGSNVTGLGAGTPAVELEWFVPVAHDQLTLIGALFAQTSSTDLTVRAQWAATAELFTLTGGATATLAGSYVVEAIVYQIPETDAGIIVPPMDAFHQVIQSRQGGIANLENEIRLAGQGVGRQLLRLYGQTFNGTVGVPLPVNNTNYGQFVLRYGGNEQPEVWTDAQTFRYQGERVTNCDLGAFHGFWLFDFASEHAVRDSIDMGAASELRFAFFIPNAVVLTGAACEYVQESMIGAPAAT